MSGADTTRKFRSTTEETRYHILQLLQNNIEHTRMELLDYVRANASKPESITENLFTGALKTLIGNQKVDVLERGLYKIRSTTEKPMELKEKVVCILEQTKKHLNQVCCINVLEMDSSQLETAKQVKEFIGIMEQMIESIQQGKKVSEKKEKKS